jgi:hypothetical protein
MQALVWIGAAMALAGLAGLGWCIREAMRFRRASREGAVDPQETRRRLGRLQAMNMASVGTAFLGLALVAVATILG